MRPLPLIPHVLLSQAPSALRADGLLVLMVLRDMWLCQNPPDVLGNHDAVDTVSFARHGCCCSSVSSCAAMTTPACSVVALVIATETTAVLLQHQARYV